MSYICNFPNNFQSEKKITIIVNSKPRKNILEKREQSKHSFIQVKIINRFSKEKPIKVQT